MKKNNCVVLWATAAVTVVCAIMPVNSPAQATTTCGSVYEGDKYAWQASSQSCSYHDYIDVSTGFNNTAGDVCQAINAGLNALIGTGSPYVSSNGDNGVIDARGVPPPSGGTFGCTTSPFVSGGLSPNPGVTVLLPAGTISVSAPWYLPPNTRLIGVGSSITTSSGVTTLKAATGSTGAMIYMGDALGTYTLCNGNCNGISIEHLQLNGNSPVASVDGIDNYYAQELNYVNDVQLVGIAGTGLKLGEDTTIIPHEGANNSGPYTNIYFSGTGTCLNINGTNNTRGVNGLHCSGSSGSAAILLDGSNNLIQNVTITGYTGDGIAVGSNASASNNVLLNIAGPTATSSSSANVVHIYNATDVTLLGISGGNGGNIIFDEVSNATVPYATATPRVGLYILGEAMTGTGSGTPGYSRFTTSGSLPTWFQGTAVPSPSPETSCTTNGSLYSVTATAALSSGSSTLWGCFGGFWVALKSGV